MSQHILPFLEEIPGPLHQLLSLATEPPLGHGLTMLVSSPCPSDLRLISQGVGKAVWLSFPFHYFLVSIIA